MADFVDPFAQGASGAADGWVEAQFSTGGYDRLRIGPYLIEPRKAGILVLVGDIVTEFDYSKGRNGKKASGADGATNVNRGLKPRQVEITLEAWDGRGETTLDTLTPLLQALENPLSRESWRVEHPKLRRNKFSEAVVVRVTEVGDSPGAQTLQTRVLLREERTRPNVTHKSKGFGQTLVSVPITDLGEQAKAPALRELMPPPPRLR